MAVAYTPFDTQTDYTTNPSAATSIVQATIPNTLQTGLQAVIALANANEAAIADLTPPDMTNYYTKAEVDSELALKADASALSDYLTTAAAGTTYATIAALDDKADASDLADYLTTANAASTYATIAALDDKADTADLADYLTTADAATTYATVANLTSGLAAKLDLAGGTMTGDLAFSSASVTGADDVVFAAAPTGFSETSLAAILEGLQTRVAALETA